jgi:hypothetical protein
MNNALATCQNACYSDKMNFLMKFASPAPGYKATIRTYFVLREINPPLHINT